MDSLLVTLSAYRMPLAFGWLLVLVIWESVVPFFGFFLRRGKERLRHGVLNLAVGIPGAVLPALGLVAIFAAVARWTEANGFGFLNLFDLPLWTHALGAILTLDLFTYWWHRANHRVAFLWRFHRVHHADSNMDASTAVRFHIGEIAISAALRIAVVFLAGIQLWELALFETAMLAVVQFHHANIGLGPGLDRWLRVFITTPAMHKVHHSRLRSETDSNYTALFSFWDRLFRTLRLRKDPHTIDFGLDEFDEPDHRTLTGLYTMPFAKPKIPRRGKR